MFRSRVPLLGKGWSGTDPRDQYETAYPQRLAVQSPLPAESALRYYRNQPFHNKEILPDKPVCTVLQTAFWPAASREKPESSVYRSVQRRTYGKSPSKSAATSYSEDAARRQPPCAPAGCRTDGQAQGGWQTCNDIQELHILR